MQYWLMKSEPSVYSWDDLVREGEDHWDGVRNYQARNNMRKMQLGDRAFFYHSNVTPGFVCKAVVGIMEVSKLAYPDHTDPTGKFEMVNVRPLQEVPQPVTLEAIKQNPKLADMALIKLSRLSVQPVTEAEWKEVCRMGGLQRSE